MIRLNVSEQQLFDMIMAIYSMGNSEEADSETVRRREALLEKLHRAFDSKIIAPRAGQAHLRVAAQSSEAVGRQA